MKHLFILSLFLFCACHQERTAEELLKYDHAGKLFQQDTPGDFGEAISEYQAYEAVLEHPYFEKASSEYRNIIVERYDYFKKML